MFEAKSPFSPRCAALAVFLSFGYLSAIFNGFGFFLAVPSFFLIWFYVVMFGVSVPAVYVYLRQRGTSRGVIAAEVLVFVVLVLWGLGLNYLVGPQCTESECDGMDVHRPLAYPSLLYFSGVYVMTVLGYAISRRRTEPLPLPVEGLLLSILLLGCVLQGLLLVHFGRWIVLGLALAPIALPGAMPLMGLFLFVRQVRARLTRLRSTLPAATGAAGLLGFWVVLYAVVTALFERRSTAAFEVFTRTCDYTFSQIPIEKLPCSGHYLCTVAACGHPGLVKPLRWGRRRGISIIVNRQLAIANAFEELLSERFPRFGRMARRAYDRCGLPICRFIRTPLAADLTYVCMKPVEWCFYAFLLLVDRHCPEARIARMYVDATDATSP